MSNKHLSFRTINFINPFFIDNPNFLSNINDVDVSEKDIEIEEMDDTNIITEQCNDKNNRIKFINFYRTLLPAHFYSIEDVIKVEKNILIQYFNGYINKGLIHGYLDQSMILINDKYDAVILGYKQPTHANEENRKKELINIFNIFRKSFNTDEEYFQNEFENNENIKIYVNNFFNIHTSDILKIYDFDSVICKLNGLNYESLKNSLNNYVNEYGSGRLKHLTLSFIDIDVVAEAMELLTNFVNLQELNLINTELNDGSLSIIIQNLPKFNRLYRFDFYDYYDNNRGYVYIRNSLIEYVGIFSKLKYLKNIYLRNINDRECVNDIIENLPMLKNLQELIIYDSKWKVFDDEMILILRESLQRLTKVKKIIISVNANNMEILNEIMLSYEYIGDLRIICPMSLSFYKSFYKLLRMRWKRGSKNNKLEYIKLVNSESVEDEGAIAQLCLFMMTKPINTDYDIIYKYNGKKKNLKKKKKER